jgi:ribokinase
MQQDIVVVGSLNMDVVLEVDRFPGEGETLHARAMSTGCGGKGGNQAVACARLMVAPALSSTTPSSTTPSANVGRPRVRMVGLVGDDAYGQALRDGLVAGGVDATQVGTHAGPSGSAFVFVDPAGHNRIVVVAGVNAALAPAHIDAAAACFDDALLVMQLESPLPTVMHAAEVARVRGATVVLNPSPVADLPDRLWRSVDIVIANEVEARQLAGVEVGDADQALAAARALLAKGPHLAVITLGAQGVVCAGAATRGAPVEELRVPARRVNALDTTAAGDTFTGAFCAALAAGRPLAAALQRGVDAAAICVTRRGAMASVPYASDVDSAAGGAAAI